MKPATTGWPLLIPAVLALGALQLWLRPLLPVDETRYLGVAWEMWQRGDFLVPHLNGEPYSHKPPLLFWLVQGMWSLTGVSETAARWLFPLTGLLCLWLSAGLARRLWPRDGGAVAAITPWLLFGGLFWMNFQSLVQFDLLLALAALLAWHGTLIARQEALRGWGLVAAGIGMGVLAKGPVILLPVLPVIFLAPWWARRLRPARWASWYAGGFVALLLGAASALAWAIPAGLAGGEAYRQAIFWGQSAGRVVDSFAHAEPWWSYLWWLPLMWLPWLLWPASWKAVRAGVSAGLDDGVRFCLAAILPALLLFSLVSGKQGKYLLPLFPLMALLLARWLALFEPHRERPYRLYFVALLLAVAGAVLLALPRIDGLSAWTPGMEPLRGLELLAIAAVLVWFKPADLAMAVRVTTLAGVVASGVVYLALVPALRPAFDLQPLAAWAAEQQADGRPLAWAGKYHGQLQFPGRLEQRIEPLGDEAACRRWAAAHPDGFLIENLRDSSPPFADAVFTQRYRSGWLVARPAAATRWNAPPVGAASRPR